MTKAQLIFDVPDKPVERDRIEIFPQLGASVSDLIIESIEVYTE